MITISTLLILLYSYSIYKIRKDSGSWKDFDPFESNIFVYFIFLLGTSATSGGIIFLMICAAINNIIP